MTDALNRHWVICSVLVLLIPNLAAYVVFFPGYFQADYQLNILYIAKDEPSQWHSLLWGYLAYPFIYMMPSYAVYGLVQIGLFVVSVIFSVWRLRVAGILRSGLWLVALFALFPTFVLYNLLYSGDVCFAYALMALTSMLAETVARKGDNFSSRRYAVAFVALVVLMCGLRKNAILVAALLLVCLPLAFKPMRRKMLAVGSAAFVLSIVINPLLQIATDAEASPSQELLSVPATQIARVYATGGYVPESVNQELSSVRSPEQWAECYQSFSADKAKMNVELTPGFIKSWIELGICNPGTYFRAYVLLEYPFWTFGATTWGDDPIAANGAAIDFGNNDNFTLDNREGLDGRYLAQFGGEREGIWQMPARLYGEINGSHLPFLVEFCNYVMFNRGLPFWVCLAGLAISIRFRFPGRGFVVFSPVIAVLLSFLCFAPVALMRYAASMYYALPILVLFLVWGARNLGIGRDAGRREERKQRGGAGAMTGLSQSSAR